MKLIDHPKFREMLLFWKKSHFASIGFCGSPNGMTLGQIKALKDIFAAVRDTVGVYQVHHSSRLGGDEEAHHLALAMRAVVVTHPHSDALYRAYLVGQENRPKWPALRATQDIVEACSLILVAPMHGMETHNVHTWDIVELARKARKAVITIVPEMVYPSK